MPDRVAEDLVRVRPVQEALALAVRVGSGVWVVVCDREQLGDREAVVLCVGVRDGEGESGVRVWEKLRVSVSGAELETEDDCVADGEAEAEREAEVLGVPVRLLEGVGDSARERERVVVRLMLGGERDRESVWVCEREREAVGDGEGERDSDIRVEGERDRVPDVVPVEVGATVQVMEEEDEQEPVMRGLTEGVKVA